MILLDTNVVSEPMRVQPDARVLAWMDAQPLETLFLSAITVAELRTGVALLPHGKRQDSLRADLEDRLLPLFAQRVLAFDLDASAHYATLRVRLHAAGRAISTADACIAAIATTHGCAVATRDTSPFDAAGLQVIDPWQA